MPSSHSVYLTILPEHHSCSNPLFLVTHYIPLACPDPVSTLLCPGRQPGCTCSLFLVRFRQTEASAGNPRTERKHSVGPPGSSLYEGKGAAPVRQPLLQLFVNFPATLLPSVPSVTLPSCLIRVGHLFARLSGPSQPAAMPGCLSQGFLPTEVYRPLYCSC